MKQITRAEIMLYEWQYDTLGSFFKGLYTIISKSDTKNRAKLRLAYPEEVEAVDKYQHEEGYWKDVKLKMKLFQNKDFNVPEINQLQTKY